MKNPILMILKWTNKITLVLTLFAVSIPTSLCADPNDQISEAWELRSDNYLSRIDSGTDVDMYYINASAGHKYGFDVDITSGSQTSWDPYLRLFNSSGTELAISDDELAPGEDDATFEPYLEHTFTTAGRYYIAISGYPNRRYNPIDGTGDDANGSTGECALRLTDLGGSGGQLQFTVYSYSVNENAGSVRVTVTRTGGSSGAASATIFLLPGTADLGSDYTAAPNQNLSWSSGDSSPKSVDIPIVNDSIYEGQEYFNVSLQNVSGATVGDPGAARVDINDDDSPSSPGTLQFLSSGYSVNENGGSVRVTVTRTGGSSGAARAQVVTASGTAASGSDYTHTSIYVNWADGDSANKDVDIPIINDSAVEGSETFIVGLYNISGAGGGSTLNTTVTILDDDSGDTVGGLVAYYPFNGNANDESGNGYNGINHGATLATDRNGNINSSYYFDGVNDYIDLGKPLGSTPTSFTLCAWVQIPDQSSSAGGIGELTILTQRHVDHQAWPTLGARYSSGVAEFMADGPSHLNYASGSVIYGANWFFICGVKSGSIYKLFINGAYNSQLMDDLAINSSSNLHLMHHPAWAKFTRGKVDDVLIYNRALSSSEIQQLYNGQLPAIPQKGTLQFSASSATVNENGDSVRVTVTRTGGSSGAARAQVVTQSGTAASGSDYTHTSTYVTWADGNSVNKDVDIPIINDSTVEGSETFSVGLYDISGAAPGSPLNTTVTILDDDRGSPLISVTPSSRNFGSVTVGSSADLTFTVQNGGGGTLSGSASVSSPFSIVSGGSYSLSAGQSQTVTVRFSPSSAVSYNQNVTFTGGGGATRAVSGTGVGAAGTLQFSVSAVRVNEDAGSVTLTVTRTGGSSGAATVNYATLSGTALAGSDYTAAFGTLSWWDGESAQKSITINIDQISGGPKYFYVDLSSAAGARLGSPSRLQVTIEDNVLVYASIRTLSGYDQFYVNNTINFECVLTGRATDGLTCSWDFSGNGQFTDATGFQATYAFSSAGTYQVRIVISDRINFPVFRADLQVSIGNAPPVDDEPVNIPPAQDPGKGNARDAFNGENEFTDWSKKDNGLMIIVHGRVASASADWVRDIATATAARLGSEGKPCPNIMAWDWRRMADVSLDMVRGNGQNQGQQLAEWIVQNITAGNINVNRPIHIIGHSAGGHVAGGCVNSIDRKIDQITTLDTPVYSRGIVTRYLPAGEGRKADIYATQWGVLYAALPAQAVADESGVGHSLRCRIITDDRYDSHTTIHCWYHRETITSNLQDGFFFSPWQYSGPFPFTMEQKGILATASSRIAMQAVSDFQTFGSVSVADGVYTITEGAGNAGIYKSMAFPSDAAAVMFEYKFTQAGDGDFLSVHVGTNEAVFIGEENSLSRQSFVLGEGDLSAVTGTTAMLTFKLVSRGQPNAQVQVRTIEVLTETTSISGGPTPFAADFDGDGKADPCMYYPESSQWKVRASSADYALFTHTLSTMGGSGWSQASADYDGDGRADPAVYQESTGTWRVMLSGDNYALLEVANFLGGSGWTAAPADFDDDGKADPAVYQEETSKWTQKLSGSDYNISPYSYSCGGIGYSPAPGRFQWASGMKAVAYQRSTGMWFYKPIFGDLTRHQDDLGGPDYFPVVADYDGDGWSDKAVCNPTTGEWRVKLSSAGDREVAVDLSFLDEVSNAAWQSAFGSMNYRDKAKPVSIVPIKTIFCGTRGDYNGDGRTDLAVQSRGLGQWYVRAFSKLGGKEEQSEGVTYSIPPVTKGQYAMCGDYDGDRMADPVMYDEQAGTWTVMLSGNQYQQTVQKGLLGGPGYWAVATDVDGDRMADPAVYLQSSGKWQFLLSNKEYGQVDLPEPLGGAGWVPVVADYDGDGKDDPAVYEETSGKWEVLLSDDQYSVLTFAFGEAGDIAVPGDYDGDGKTDPAVYSPGLGRLCIGSMAKQEVIGDWRTGLAGWLPLSGDYDLDGKDDIGLYNPGTGKWNVYGADGRAILVNESFGGEGYLPVTGVAGPVKTGMRGWQLGPGVFDALLKKMKLESITALFRERKDKGGWLALFTGLGEGRKVKPEADWLKRFVGREPGKVKTRGFSSARVEEATWMASEVMRLVTKGSPPAGEGAVKPVKLQWEILARRSGESEFALLKSGSELASEQDEYLIAAQPLTAGYLYLFQVDAQGQVDWLFPANKQFKLSVGANPVKAGKVIQIPAEKPVFRLDDKVGVESVYAVFSATRWPELEKALAGAKAGELKAGQLAPARKPGVLITRGVGEKGAEMKELQVQWKEQNKTRTIDVPSEAMPSDGAFMIMERQFKHVGLY